MALFFIACFKLRTQYTNRGFLKHQNSSSPLASMLVKPLKFNQNIFQSLLKLPIHFGQGKIIY